MADVKVISFPVLKLPPIADDAAHALAEALASFQGNLAKFESDRRATKTDTGVYASYMAAAGDVIERARLRGYDLVPAARFGQTTPAVTERPVLY